MKNYVPFAHNYLGPEVDGMSGTVLAAYHRRTRCFFSRNVRAQTKSHGQNTCSHFPRLVHEIMSFVTRPRSQPMSVFVANEYLELTQLRLKLRKPNGDISLKKLKNINVGRLSQGRSELLFLF